MLDLNHTFVGVTQVLVLMTKHLNYKMAILFQ